MINMIKHKPTIRRRPFQGLCRRKIAHTQNPAHILIHTLVMEKKKRQLPTSLAMFRKDLKKSTLAWLSPVQYKIFTSEEQ